MVGTSAHFTAALTPVPAGYGRIVLALLAFYLMPSCPWPAVFCYLLSALLDSFDGHAARALNQCKKRPPTRGLR